MKKVNILIVDDEAMFREALGSVLEKEPFVNAVYLAGDEETFVRELASRHIQIILLDVRLKRTNGFELMKKIKRAEASPAVIALTNLDGPDVVINLLKAGVQGIMHKSDPIGEIAKAMKVVFQSKSYYTESVLKVIHDNPQEWNEIPSIGALLPYEKDILSGIARGATSKEIARELKMSPRTVETYRLRLLKKFGTSNSAVLVAYAFKNGIL